MNRSKHWGAALICFFAAIQTGFAREWEDVTGAFRIEAEFVEYEDGQVVLKRSDNGKIIRVPLSKLCARDRRFVSSAVRTERGKPKDPVADPKSEKATNVITNSLGMKFKLIEPGRVEPAEGEPVEITKPYAIGVHEVTQQQWLDLIGTKPWRYFDAMEKLRSFEKEGKASASLNLAFSSTPEVRARFLTDPASAVHFRALGGTAGEPREWPTIPVNSLTWWEAAVFCIRLSAKEGKLYRLPTSEEWEYACRAGATTKYALGDDPVDIKFHGWFSRSDQLHLQELREKLGAQLTPDSPLPVGALTPNAWGLYDMHGNVAEYVLDPSHSASPAKPGSIRGGSLGHSFDLFPENASATCSYSRSVEYNHIDSHTGFRVVLDPTGKPPTELSDLPLPLRLHNLEWHIKNKVESSIALLHRLEGDSLVFGVPPRRNAPIEDFVEKEIPLSAFESQGREYVNYIEMLADAMSK
ncbi:MAG: SUMF1/EgtB/PvdO family nonheme iron enzyme [Planctomycetota bacterium]|nr:SUMF1/EgtB/PvdO family nonheme iron enzyme [Planctomycetota bacterium]